MPGDARAPSADDKARKAQERAATMMAVLADSQPPATSASRAEEPKVCMIAPHDTT